MDADLKDKSLDESDLVFGYRECQTENAKWLCIENIHQKFHRPNFYDIGGTYIQNVPVYWFMFKTECVSNIFLLHLFVTSRQGGSFYVSVSYSSHLRVEKRGSAYLSPTVKEFCIQNSEEHHPNYLTTYSFSDIDVDVLDNKKLYIAVTFSPNGDSGISNNTIDSIKMNHDFSALLSEPICSDFTIESAEGDKFKVHKALLAAQSEVFKAMLKEENPEGQNCYVKLVDVSTDDLKKILEFIYTGTIKDFESSNFFNLLILSDQYFLFGLRELAQYTLSLQLSTENALEILVLADMHNSDTLKNAAMKFIKKNPKTLKTNTFKELKNAELTRELCEFLIATE